MKQVVTLENRLGHTPNPSMMDLYTISDHTLRLLDLIQGVLDTCMSNFYFGLGTPEDPGIPNVLYTLLGPRALNTSP